MSIGVFMVPATGKNISSITVITIARLSSAAGTGILLRLRSSEVKMNIATSFAGILFILKELRNPAVLSSLIYAVENGKSKEVHVERVTHKEWRVIVTDQIGNTSEEILKLPVKLFVSKSNFKYLSSFPKITFNEFYLQRLEGTEYEST